MKKEGHVVILGWDHFSEIITWELLHAKREVAVITQSDEKRKGIQEQFEGQTVEAIKRSLTSYETF